MPRRPLRSKSGVDGVLFYEALGFKIDQVHRDRETGAPRYADLSYQGAELGLGAISSNDDPEYRAWVGTPLGAGVLVYFSVPDVDRVFEKAKGVGAVIEYEPTDRTYGRVFGLNDPDGYVISFIKEPRRATSAAKKVASKAKKAAGKVKTAARKASSAKSPAAKSLEASRRQAIKKGATGKTAREMRRSDRGLKRAR